MGWSGGTRIFDAVCKAVLSNQEMMPVHKRELLKDVIKELECMDWDVQYESKYWDDPTVKLTMKELHPKWFVDEP